MAIPLPASAQLASAHQLARDLSRTVTELGPVSGARHLQRDLTALAAYCDEECAEIDMLITGRLTSEQATLLARWISSTFDPSVLETPGDCFEQDVALTGRMARVRIYDLEHAPAQKVGAPRPAILILACADASGADSADPEAMFEVVDERALLLVIEPANADVESALARLKKQRTDASFETVSDLSLTTEQLDARLPASIHPAFRALAVLHGVNTAAKALRTVIDQEQRSMRAKRLIAQQESAKLQQPPGNPQELATEVRSRLQRGFSEFERATQEGLRSLFLPQIGAVAKAVEQRLQKLDRFEEQKGEKTIALRLGERVEESFLTLIRQACWEHCMQERERMEALFTTLQQQGNDALDGAGAPAIEVRHVVIPEQRLERLLDSAVRIDRPYRGELPNPGVQEYIQQGKKYLNIGVAILSIGTAGMSLTKLLPAKVVLGITLSLIAAGLATLPQRIRSERAENLSRELDRARDLLRSEARRIFSEVERDWVATVGEALRDEQAFYMQQVDLSVREGQARRTTEIADDRRRLQRQTGGMDATDRSLAAAKRGRDTVESSASTLRATLVQQVASARQLSRRPA